MDLKAKPNLFENIHIDDIQPSWWLSESLDIAYLTPPTNEKAKSERLVSPILLEVYKKYMQSISFGSYIFVVIWVFCIFTHSFVGDFFVTGIIGIGVKK